MPDRGLSPERAECVREVRTVGLETLARQGTAIGAAREAAERAYTVARARYDAGQTAYLDVLDARRTLVAVRRNEAVLAGERALSTVALVRALGGGWQAEQHAQR